MISVHIVRDKEFSTPDNWIGDDQLPARVWRMRKKTPAVSLHHIHSLKPPNMFIYDKSISRDEVAPAALSLVKAGSQYCAHPEQEAPLWNIVPHNSIKPIICYPFRRGHNVRVSSEMTPTEVKMHQRHREGAETCLRQMT